MTPLRITRSVQSLHRLQHIARVLTQHGFGHVVDRLDLRRFVPLIHRRSKTRLSNDGDRHATIGSRLKRVAHDLGPIFVKLGQMLASRPDIVPPDILEELRSLQDQVEPFDSNVARTIIAEELGHDASTAFATIDDTPIASGSIGQVYRATLAGGRSVVIKVRRPGADQQVRQDLLLLRWLAEALERWVAEARPYHPIIVLDEFERVLLTELDYMHEAATTARLHEAFADDDQVSIPEVIWSHTTSKVLTLEAIEGENIEHAIEHAKERHETTLDRKALAHRLVDVYLKQFFEIGTFHADPHPGNILVSPPAKLGLIDFGQAGVISDATAGQLLMLLIGTVIRDVEMIADALSDMGASSLDTDRHLLTRDLHLLVEKYCGQPLGRLNLSTVFQEAADTIRQNNLSIPRDVLLMLKSLATIWGVALRLDPDLDVAALLRPRLGSMIRDRLSPRRVARTASVTMWHFLKFMKSAPRQLHEVLRQVSSGKWQVNVRHDNLEILGLEMERASHRLAASIVIAAIVVASSMVVTSDSTLRPLGIALQTYGFFGYVFAGLMGVGLIIAILRGGRLS